MDAQKRIEELENRLGAVRASYKDCNARWLKLNTENHTLRREKAELEEQLRVAKAAGDSLIQSKMIPKEHQQLITNDNRIVVNEKAGLFTHESLADALEGRSRMRELETALKRAKLYLDDNDPNWEDCPDGEELAETMERALEERGETGEGC